jgi:hypothetical protein
VQKYVSPKTNRLVDFSQNGEIFISNSEGLLYLLTNNDGALRLITLTKLNEVDGTLQGLILTKAKLAFYHPAVSAIFLQKVPSDLPVDELIKQVGPVHAGTADYELADTLLREIEQNVGVFALPPVLTVVASSAAG